MSGIPVVIFNSGGGGGGGHLQDPQALKHLNYLTGYTSLKATV